MGTPLGPKYIPYTYMDPLGKQVLWGARPGPRCPCTHGYPRRPRRCAPARGSTARLRGTSTGLLLRNLDLDSGTK